jgi:hypothetical protein
MTPVPGSAFIRLNRRPEEAQQVDAVLGGP